MKMSLEYDGKYPNFCAGRLFITVDSVRYDFGDHCLCSGGYVWFDKEWDEQIESGPWSIEDWPVGFPEHLKEEVLFLVNQEIPWGCCGGCV
jgi:hypothetical protein